MENRYELFSKVGARNIAGYNAKVAEYNAQSKRNRKRPTMKTGKKTIFRKVKLMVPLVLLTASLGACSL
ncbi:hypothetical protein, partial [Streptococcus gordonii]|uniref:hypothetical protein n=1 Tax=Streptococcus gordonii TaxID=1302 RepID=UPI0023AF03C0